MKKYNSGNKNCYYFLNRLLKKADLSLFHVWQNFQHIEPNHKKIQKMSKNLPSHHWKTAFRTTASKAKNLSPEEIQTLNKILEIVRNPNDFLYDSVNRNKKIINFRSDKSETEFLEKCKEIYNNISGMLQDEQEKNQTHANNKEDINNNSEKKSEENSQIFEENDNKARQFEHENAENMEEEKVFVEENGSQMSYYEGSTQDRTNSHENFEYPQNNYSNISPNEFQCKNLVRYEIMEDEERQSLKKKIEQLENEIKLLKMKQQIQDEPLEFRRTMSQQEDFVTQCIKCDEKHSNIPNVI